MGRGLAQRAESDGKNSSPFCIDCDSLTKIQVQERVGRGLVCFCRTQRVLSCVDVVGKANGRPGAQDRQVSCISCFGASGCMCFGGVFVFAHISEWNVHIHIYAREDIFAPPTTSWKISLGMAYHPLVEM